MDCVICARRRGERPNDEPIGGYVYEDESWYAYHAPVDRSVLGQLFLISRRHYLDFAAMTPDEAASYGVVLQKLVMALKQVLGAERVDALVTLEGVPHLHVWLIPRRKHATERGWTFINQVMNRQYACQEADARGLVDKLRRALAE